MSALTRSNTTTTNKGGLAPAKGRSMNTKEKKAERERKRAEEQRRIEEQLNEARERELMFKADEESRKYEKELAYLKQENERIFKEKGDVSQWDGDSMKWMNEYNRKKTRDDEWSKYVMYNSIDTLNEADVNTYITLWREKEDTNLDETLKDFDECDKIISDLEANQAEAEDKNNIALATRCHANVVQLKELSLNKIDRMTAHVIQYADEQQTTSSKSSEVLISTCSKNNSLRYGLWINLAKNPRIKSIDFPNIEMSVEVPKNIALTTIALRMVIFRENILKEGKESEFHPLGGVLFVELLQVPPPPKKVKAWTLRQVTALSTQLQKLQYPLVSNVGDQGATSSTWPAIHIVYNIQKNVVIPENPLVAWWDFENADWKFEGISDIVFSADKKTLSFNTFHTAPHALVYNLYSDLPLKSWCLKPISSKLSSLTIYCAASFREIQFEIGEGYCRLLQPQSADLLPLRNSKLSPSHLLKKLQNMGINVIGDHKAMSYLTTHGHEVKAKNAHLEKEVYRQISRISSGFEFQNSKWNQDIGEKICTLRVKIGGSKSNNLRVGDEKEMDQNFSSGWKTLEFNENKVVVVKTDEQTESVYSGEPFAGTKEHQHVIHVVNEFPAVIGENNRKARDTLPSLANTTFNLLDIIKPLSFTV